MNLDDPVPLLALNELRLRTALRSAAASAGNPVP